MIIIQNYLSKNKSIIYSEFKHSMMVKSMDHRAEFLGFQSLLYNLTTNNLG